MAEKRRFLSRNFRLQSWWVIVVWFRRVGKCSVIACSKAWRASGCMQRRWRSGSLTGGDDDLVGLAMLLLFVSDLGM